MKMKRQNKVVPAIKKTNLENMSFHVQMRNVLLIAQIFGYMPVSGIYQPDISSVKFSWISWRMVYAVLTTAGTIFIGIAQLKKNVTSKIQMLDIHKLCLYATGICSSIFFIMLARKWPKFVKKWTGVERAMSVYGWPSEVNKKVNKVVLIFMILVLVEYILIQVHRLLHAANCKEAMMEVGVINYFLKNKFIGVYSIFPYDMFSGIILMYVHFQTIFSCTFVDVFIIVISIALASRLEQITRRIKLVALARVQAENVWKQLREDYDRLECLCKTVNSNIPYFIILSFVGNLFLILIQLFNSLKVKRRFMERAYLYYSFGVVVVRTVCVCIYGAAVNDESRKPLTILYDVPDSVYNKEIERLIRQISTSKMALSGLNFFRIKRGLVLKIAGALVTYELVLIQFTGNILTLDNNSTSCSPS